MHRPPTPEAEATLADELSVARPGLSAPYAAALPGARAAVLTRLWRALVYEPMPWVARRETGRDGLTLHLADGRRLHGPHADPYATASYVTQVRLDGTPHDRPERLVLALAVPHAAAFAAELGDSVASLALSRASQPVSDHEPVTGWEWEQRIVDGHPYHPNCRSRPGFSAAEQLAYGPEHRPLVELGLVASDDCLVTGEWPKWLRDEERVLIPVHPWQVAHVLDEPVQEGFAVHPLMSLRTLALPDGPHIKTALSARLTSSVRDISVYSIETAATVSAFMETITERLDVPLHITRTLGAATANSPDLAAVLRESPDLYANPGERVVPVAALATTALPQSPAWLAEFTRLALTVCLRLLDLGVALEAHGQNLLVVLSPPAPLSGSSTATWPTSGSARPAWPTTASRSRISPDASSRTTRAPCGANFSAPSSAARWARRRDRRPLCARRLTRSWTICRTPRIWRPSAVNRSPPRR